MKLLAHISDDKTRTQTIEEHLTSTAALAGNFAAAFGAQAEATYTALLHDIGKYSAGFQQRLQGGPPVDHSTAGAKGAIQDGNIPAALAVARHLASPTSEIRMTLPTKARWSAAPSGGSKIAPSGNRRSPLPKPLCRRGCSASRTT